jgi:hypothetical protein
LSTILPRLEEFGASGLAWGRIVEGIIVEELWKHLVNAAPVITLKRSLCYEQELNRARFDKAKNRNRLMTNFGLLVDYVD